MFTSAIDFNRAAVRWAHEHGKPLVGNGDVHRLEQLGTTFSLVDAEPCADAICDAVRAGRVRVEARPHSSLTARETRGGPVLRQPAARPVGANTLAARSVLEPDRSDMFIPRVPLC